MSKVFISMGVSADGFIAGPNGGAQNPNGDGGLEIHNWFFGMHAFRSRMGMEGGQTTGKDNAIVRNIFTRCGAYIMGKRMFMEGEANWPEEAPFRKPVFVLTHEARAPWKRPGKTVFHFSSEPLEAVLQQARKAAGTKDVRISGGSETICAFLHAGLVDELMLHVSPVILGSGVRLFDGLDREAFDLEIAKVVPSAQVTHMIYKVNNK